MNNHLLISNKYKVLGWIAFVLFGIMGIATMYFEFKLEFLELPFKPGPGLGDWSDFNLTNEIALGGTITGLLLIAFSKEIIEDEYISFLRLTSWQSSILISYFILIILNFMFYGNAFFNVLIYNVFLIPLIFILKFNYSLYKLKSERNSNEK